MRRGGDRDEMKSGDTRGGHHAGLSEGKRYLPTMFFNNTLTKRGEQVSAGSGG